MAHTRATPRATRGKNPIAMAIDILGAALLAIYALILGPLGVLRGPIAIERAVWYMWVLVPQGLMARSIRAAIDWRFGHFDAAIAQLEGLVGATEDYTRERPNSRVRRRVLEDFYTVLTRAYLHAGHIDDAMLVVIRAKKSMSIDRLPGLAELDAKTAHLVRAGLAAGRLLDGQGLATMFVKSNQPAPTPPAPPAQRPSAPKQSPVTGRQGATRGPMKRVPPTSTAPGSSPDLGQIETEAKVIPFPLPRQEQPNP